MDIKEAIYTRRSIRAYQSKPVEKSAIEQCIDAAIQAPNAMAEQPWSFAVIQDAAAMKELSDRTKAYLMSIMDKMPAFERYRDWLSNPDFDIFYGAPALVIVCARPKTSPAPATDCAVAAQNLMLMARSLGIGSCWIGFAGIYLSTAEGKKSLGIPEDYRVEAPIILGYPQGEFSTMDRNPVDIVFWK